MRGQSEPPGVIHCNQDQTCHVLARGFGSAFVTFPLRVIATRSARTRRGIFKESINRSSNIAVRDFGKETCVHLDVTINIDYAGHSFDSYPNGVAVGVLECAFMRNIPGMGNKFVGDFRNGHIDFGWDTFTNEEKIQKRAIELNNGRTAQFGILGLMAHELIIPLGYDADLPIIGHLA
jgi:hypothetical protein